MTQHGMKTNERPGTRAVLRHARFSAYKARVVLDLIRNLPVADAMDELNRCEREAGRPIGKLLASAVANAGANDGLPADELFVAACFADEGPTMRRFRPRARGRATRINKRTTHITIIVGRLSSDEISERRERGGAPADAAAARARRVAASRDDEPTEDPADAADEADEVETTPVDDAAVDVEAADKASADGSDDLADGSDDTADGSDDTASDETAAEVASTDADDSAEGSDSKDDA